MHGWRNEFTVFGAFVAVSFLGLLVIGAIVLFGRGGTEQLIVPEAVTAPTVEEYRTAARQEMRAFLGSAGQLTVDDIAGIREELLTIVTTAQDGLIAQRVPSEEREAHLALVLLLERWKRALGGDDLAAQEDVFARTQEFIAAHPWIVP
jgi:hypothetical protein